LSLFVVSFVGDVIVHSITRNPRRRRLTSPTGSSVVHAFIVVVFIALGRQYAFTAATGPAQDTSRGTGYAVIRQIQEEIDGGLFIEASSAFFGGVAFVVCSPVNIGRRVDITMVRR